MWIPESAAELEAAVREGSLEEGSQLDFKKELPNKRGNADIAVDVSALTVDRGMLVYGVGEDENKRPTQLTPIELAGAPERVDQVARTSVNEPPVIHTLSLRSRRDDSHPLTEPEIARLYARRQSSSFDRREHLKSIIDSAPFEENADLAYLHAFARPVVIDEEGKPPRRPCEGDRDRMALGFYITAKGFTQERYDRTTVQLEEAGAGTPDGRISRRP
jgi:hypothetical protein